MTRSKLNQTSLVAAAALVFAIATIQGCSSSDDQAAPTAGTGGTASGGKGGASATGGKGGSTVGGSTSGGTGGGNGGNAGDDTIPEGGAGGAGPGDCDSFLNPCGLVCEAAEDHGEAVYLADHGGKLPDL